MGRRNTATVVIWGEQINPHAPEFRAVPDPLTSSCSQTAATRESALAWASVRE